MTEFAGKKKNFFNDRKLRSRILFAAAILALPVLQQIIFYIGVNFNSVLQAFMRYEEGVSGYIVKFAGIDNFVKAVEEMGSRTYLFKNSLIMYAVNLFISLPLGLIFSYYIYKKFPFSKTFRMFLFMPQLVSGLVFSLLFKYIVTDVYQGIVLATTGERVMGLLEDSNTRTGMWIFFNVWIGFGVNVIMYSGSMAGIDQSIVESAELDGVNIIQEFWYITIPMIFPTFVSFLIMGIAGFCTNQASLLSLFGLSAADLSTLGYFLYSASSRTDYVANLYSPLTFGELSALGLLLTLIVAPITLGVRTLLLKFGPSEN